MLLSLRLDTLEKIASTRDAVEAQYAKGTLSREERAAAMGTLAEAEALLLLRQWRDADGRAGGRPGSVD